MSMYVEQNLGRDEVIVAKAVIHPISVIVSWIGAAIFLIIACTLPNMIKWFGFFLFIMVLISAISKTISVSTSELAVTNKKLIGKFGLINTKSMDAPLNKVQNISVSSGLFGKMFGYGHISIHTASGNFMYRHVKQADNFKAVVMSQIEAYEENEAKRRASEIARAMMNNQGK